MAATSGSGSIVKPPYDLLRPVEAVAALCEDQIHRNICEAAADRIPDQTRFGSETDQLEE